MAIRVAIIGCGGMARGHLNAYLRIQEIVPGKVELAAMCDPVRKNAEDFASRVNDATGKMPMVYEDTDAMLAAEELDGADICTPHCYHHINAVKCLNSGVNVIVEKPIGITIKATRAIIEAANANGRIAATAENIRRAPSRRTAWWLINEKKMLGDVTMFFSQHASHLIADPLSPWHWRLDLKLGGGGMVMDSGAHYCDTLRYLFGDPDTVYARVRQVAEHKVTKDGVLVNDENEDTWVATINFKSGTTGLWTWSRAAPAHDFTHIVYYGTEGCLVDNGDIFHGPHDGAEVILKNGTRYAMEELVKEYMAGLTDAERDNLFPHGITDSVLLECYDFVDAIENNRPVEVDGELGLRAKAICEAIYESNACGQVVSYDDVVDGKIDAYQKPINERWNL